MSGYSHTIGEKIKELNENNKYACFVETGMFKGDTTLAASKHFNKVYSIELDKELFRKGRARLSEEKNVYVFQGDSSVVLKKVIKLLNGNTIFFLDAHWAGNLSSKNKTDTPLINELITIKKERGNFSDIIIIDDYGWVGNKGKIDFKKEWGSKYFPEGGVFKYDWTHVQDSEIRNMFKNKKIYLEDDRLIIHT